jgi:hypothetical protein
VRTAKELQVSILDVRQLFEQSIYKLFLLSVWIINKTRIKSSEANMLVDVVEKSIFLKLKEFPKCFNDPFLIGREDHG